MTAPDVVVLSYDGKDQPFDRNRLVVARAALRAYDRTCEMGREAQAVEYLWLKQGWALVDAIAYVTVVADASGWDARAELSGLPTATVAGWNGTT